MREDARNKLETKEYVMSPRSPIVLLWALAVVLLVAFIAAPGRFTEMAAGGVTTTQVSLAVTEVIVVALCLLALRGGQSVER